MHGDGKIVRIQVTHNVNMMQNKVILANSAREAASEEKKATLFSNLILFIEMF